MNNVKNYSAEEQAQWEAAHADATKARHHNGHVPTAKEVAFVKRYKELNRYSRENGDPEITPHKAHAIAKKLDVTSTCYNTFRTKVWNVID